MLDPFVSDLSINKTSPLSITIFLYSNLIPQQSVPLPSVYPILNFVILRSKLLAMS